MRWPIFLPLGALVIAFATIFGALLVVSNDKSDTATPARPAGSIEDGETPLAVLPTPSAVAGNVCQGIAARPAPGTPRVFSSHYTQQAEARGISIVASDGVNPRALTAAQDTIEDLFANNDLAGILVEEGAYVIITDGNEGILELPEFSCLSEEASASIIEHACGIADRADYPVVTVNEWDLLADRRGPCNGLNILYHELGHLVQGWSLDPQRYLDVKYLYQKALDAGKYDDFYAATNPNEYFAEATQAYFVGTGARGRQDRDWLQEYDPELFQLVDDVYNGR